VEFDYKIEEQVISKIENLTSYKTRMIWLGSWLYNGQGHASYSLLILQPQMV
jgi:hypothetical protein